MQDESGHCYSGCISSLIWVLHGHVGITAGSRSLSPAPAPGQLPEVGVEAVVRAVRTYYMSSLGPWGQQQA